MENRRSITPISDMVSTSSEDEIRPNPDGPISAPATMKPAMLDSRSSRKV
jgi:hypothetical protein